MRDLRKQALGLESKKTLSRKAQSKQGSPSNSAPASRNGSRVPSRDASDDDSETSDVTQWSTNSIDDVIPGPEAEEAAEGGLRQELGDRINALVDRKRSSVMGREGFLAGFVTILTRFYAEEGLKGRVDEVVATLLRSVKAGASGRETELALKAIALLVITVPSETLYDEVADPIKKVITDTQDAGPKVAAIHTLGVVTFYGGATADETENVMDFLLDIASSDGAIVEETDNAELVAATLQEWGFLATQLEDMEESTEIAMDTFVDQLDSSDVAVQIAAGENIALLYEKSYTEAEPEDEISDTNPDHETFDGRAPAMVKRYTVYRQQHLLLQTLSELAKASSKRLSKANRKQMHLAFTDVLNTVEKPTRGPRYSTALDEEGREYGSRMKVAVSGGGRMTIDKWWKLHRLGALKRLLQGGFLRHYEENEVVFETLPVVVE
ncbi:Interferon-related developmental regulator (IFRD) [Teratosphaeria destructans]|uniref:Interferon-related developmental regulator (IFRD) n=1 Tax=Teratosphaeria destructans TaxID=418781 RepID=A0A9W7SUA7_9PEZI|nr:Interferon-related developmental regulator (IFRD) [Teratosphaeria destructans]